MRPGEDENLRDREDLRSALDGPDEEARRRAASRLLSRYQKRIYVWCFRYVEDHERALELTQEVLLNAYRKLPDYVHRFRFSSWLFVITRNRCISDLRRPALYRECGLDPDMLQSDRPGPAQQLEETSAEDALKRLIRETLERDEQDAVHLRCFDGLAVDAITEVLDIKEKTGARGVLQRARRKLRAALSHPEDSSRDGR